MPEETAEYMAIADVTTALGVISHISSTKRGTNIPTMSPLITPAKAKKTKVLLTLKKNILIIATEFIKIIKRVTPNLKIKRLELNIKGTSKQTDIKVKRPNLERSIELLLI